MVRSLTGLKITQPGQGKDATPELLALSAQLRNSETGAVPNQAKVKRTQVSTIAWEMLKGTPLGEKLTPNEIEQVLRCGTAAAREIRLYELTPIMKIKS